jgi:4-diphosphocytidyl-2-C-methyl-D-erythritol kinase
MQALYDVPAPAKLNLFLHVIGRRPDGMHLLQSAFMLIDWCDTLHFERRADGRLSREDLGIALPADDLVLAAARALQQFTGTGQGAHIGVDKRIPTEAGMGGGSSDAATCLLALNRLWGLNLRLAQLVELGVKLGADVPFFLHGHNALVEGIGERTTPVDLPPARFAVVKPAAGLATARIFSDAQLKRDTDPAIISGFAANRSGAVDPYRFGVNDLQPVAQRLCPEVSQAVEWLGAQGLQGRMTGSGSAVFARMPGQQVLATAPVGWTARVCSNMEAHPLAGWAPSDDSSVVG